MNIVKCRFLKDGEPSGREYSYLANEELSVGDSVMADTVRGEADLVVTAVDVPEEEVEAFKDKLKYVKKSEKKPDAEKEPETVDLGF